MILLNVYFTEISEDALNNIFINLDTKFKKLLRKLLEDIIQFENILLNINKIQIQ